jgi:hypothetical protein
MNAPHRLPAVRSPLRLSRPPCKNALFSRSWQPDSIADTLKALPVAHEQLTFLAPAKIDKLLHAALRHDAATFAETRAEHNARAPNRQV